MLLHVRVGQCGVGPSIVGGLRCTNISSRTSIVAFAGAQGGPLSAQVPAQRKTLTWLDGKSKSFQALRASCVLHCRLAGLGYRGLGATLADSGVSLGVVRKRQDDRS